MIEKGYEIVSDKLEEEIPDMQRTKVASCMHERRIGLWMSTQHSNLNATVLFGVSETANKSNSDAYS